MSTESHQELTAETFKIFLEIAPLYSERKYKCPGEMIYQPIREIESFCTVCKRNKPFQFTTSVRGSSTVPTVPNKSGRTYFSYSCVSCKKTHKEFYVEQSVDEGIISLHKYGERPRMPLVRNQVLQRFLKDDSENYEKAVTCLANDYGVAAFAYFRRIVENNIDNLLSLVQKEAEASNDRLVLQKIEELRAESPMSDKIKVANLALPNYLKPDGLNPLGRLYQTLSDGIHSLSDAECLKKAEVTSECLTFLVTELTSRARSRARFKAAVGEL